MPGAADVAVEQATGLAGHDDRAQARHARAFGITISELQDVVATALGGTVAGQLYEGDRRVDIVVRLPEKLRSNPDRLATARAARDGTIVPLREVAT